jgi:UPF0755 protein
MKSIRLIVVVALLLVVVAALLSYSWFAAKPVNVPGGISLYIYPGETARQVSMRVDSLKLFPSDWSFRLLCSVSGRDKNLKVGRYDFTEDDSRWDILEILSEGISSEIKITIPEGLTLNRILRILSSAVDIDIAEFEALATDRSFVESFGIDSDSLEGYLFPETYLIPWGSPPDYVLGTIVGELTQFMSDSLQNQMEQIQFTFHELVTLASLIEAEVKDGEERALISSVYHNRIDKGMLLQCDPTVIYALGGLDRPLLYKDLEVDSPYNTYKYSGLPPGPICSPGAASLTAALYPSDTDYLYFVADGSGGHIFSKTLREHNNARQRIKLR